jgi:hypothetical protein
MQLPSSSTQLNIAACDDQLVEAAGALWDAARALVADVGQADQPRSAEAARNLLVACAEVFLDAQEVS